jgi:hypothetical protein
MDDPGVGIYIAAGERKRQRNTKSVIGWHRETDAGS